MVEHEHIWSEWKDDKPMDIKSQPTLVIMSVRQCLVPNCDAVQPRIGRLTAPNTEQEQL